LGLEQLNALLHVALGAVPEQPPVHDCSDPQAVHPLLPTAHVCMLAVVAHCVAPAAHWLVQHAPPLHAPLVHGWLAEPYTHCCASTEHVVRVAPSAHTFPAALQTGSVLQVHDALPGDPVQVWCAPQALDDP
jgi:hypothetical protein